MRHIIILSLLAAVIFFGGNNVLPLTNPDEVFYAGTAKEMATAGTWVTPYIFGQPQFEKPVLTYDLIRAGFLMFGQTPFAARFFPALFALLGVLTVYFLGRLFHADQRKAFMGAFILMTSALYIGLAKTVFTDMIFSVFILLALTAFYAAYRSPGRKTIGLILFHVFAALAVLTKGPLGFAIPLITVLIFLLWRGEQKFLLTKAFWIGLFMGVVIALPWYALMCKLYGHGFTHEFFYNDHWRRLLSAEHRSNDRWYFYPGAMLGCMFPWILAVAVSLWMAIKASLDKKAEPFEQFLLVWIVVVLVVFQPAHSKLVSYIFPLFPALALLAGPYLTERLDQLKRPGWMEVTTFVFFLFVPVLIFVAGEKYPAYLPEPLHLGAIMMVEILFLVIIGSLFLQNNIRRAVYLFGLQVPLLLFLALTASRQIDPYVSSQAAVAYLMQQPAMDGKIMASKFFIRAVKYYSGRDVVLLNFSNANFFSPHPVPDLNTDEKLFAFLQGQPVSYGIVNDHTWESLEAACRRNGFPAELLAKVGDAFVVRITVPPQVVQRKGA